MQSDKLQNGEKITQNIVKRKISHICSQFIAKFCYSKGLHAYLIYGVDIVVCYHKYNSSGQ